MRRTFTAALLSGALLLAATAPVAAQDIDTGPAVLRNDNAFGTDFTGWGQSFTAPTTERFLNSFSFDLGDVTANFSFYSFIYEWDGSKKGNVVWSGGLHNLTAANDGYFQVNTGGIGLSAAGMYLAFLESDRPRFGYARGTNNVGIGPQNSYSGGTLVTQGRYFVVRDGQNYTDANGTVHSTARDAAFRADFAATGTDPVTVTPEPVSMALLGTGLAGLAVARRRRRKTEEASA